MSDNSLLIFLVIFFASCGIIIWARKRIKKNTRPRGAATANASTQQLTPQRKSYLNEKLGYLIHKQGPPRPVFPVDEFLRQRIDANPAVESNLRLLMLQVLKHMGLNPIGVELFVVHSVFASGQGGGRAGTYQATGGTTREIELILKQDYRFPEIAAVLAHECAHYFLDSHGIAISPPQENEMLTDIATLYLGFGGITQPAYQGGRLGYLKYEEVFYLNGELGRIRMQQQRPQQAAKPQRSAGEQQAAETGPWQGRPPAKRGELQAALAAAHFSVDTARRDLSLLQDLVEKLRATPATDALSGSWETVQEIFLALEAGEVEEHLLRAEQILKKATSPQTAQEIKVQTEKLTQKLQGWNTLLCAGLRGIHEAEV